MESEHYGTLESKFTKEKCYYGIHKMMKNVKFEESLGENIKEDGKTPL